MITFNYDLSNFINTPTTSDKNIKIFDKYGVLKYSLDPSTSYLFYRNNIVYIKIDNSDDVQLDFETSEIAILALTKLNDAAKIIIQQAANDIDYYTKTELNAGYLDTRYITNTAITNILVDYTTTAHTHYLTGLTDVVLSAVTNDQVLVYKDGFWVNTAFTFDVSAFTSNYYTIDDLSSSATTVNINWIHMINTPTGVTEFGISDVYTKSEIYNKTELDSGQLDNRYYTKTLLYTQDEIYNLLDGYSLTSHTHILEDLSNVSGVAQSGETLYFYNGEWIPTTFTSAINNIFYTTAQTNEMFSLTSHTHNQYSSTSHTHNQYSLTSHTHDDRYYTETEIDTILTGKSNINHNHQYSEIINTAHTHDDRYYTESEINTILTGKSNISHNHDSEYYTKTLTFTKVEVNNILNGYYTSGQTNNILTDYYTSGQTNNILSYYYTSGQTNNLLIGKSDTGHTHIFSDLSNTSHTHSFSELSNTSHTHDFYTTSQVNNLLNNYASSNSLTAHTSLTGSTNPHKIGFNDLTTTAHTHYDTTYTKAEFIGSNPFGSGVLDGRYYTKILVDNMFATLDYVGSAVTYNNVGYYTSAQTNAILLGYYTSAQTNNLLLSKSDTGHTHNINSLTGVNILTPTNNQILLYSAGTWINSNFVQTPTDLSGYYTSAQTNNLLLGKSDTGHTHTFIGLSNTSHTHLWSDISNTSHTHNQYSLTSHNHDLEYYTKILTYSKVEINNIFNGYYTSAQTNNILNGYYTSAQTNNILNGYYNSAQTNTLLLGKSDTSHSHSFSGLSNTSHTHLWSDISNTSHTHDFYTTSQIDNKLLSYASYNSLTAHTSLTGSTNPHKIGFNDLTNTSHTHDDRYYTITQLNTGSLDVRYYTHTYIDGVFASLGYVNSAVTYNNVGFYTSAQTNALLLGYSLTSHTHNINSLSGVSIITPVNQNILVYSGGTWVNKSLASLNIDFSQYYTSSQTNALLLGKSDTGHTHNFINLSNTSHTHLWSNLSNTSHTHLWSDISNTSHTHDDRYYTETEIDTNIYSKIVIDGKLAGYYLKTELYNSAQTNAILLGYYTSAQTNAILLSKSDTGHTHFLSGLTDVSISGITNGHVLVYSAGTWINSGISMDLSNYYTVAQINNIVSGISFATGATILNELADVNTSSNVAGQSLVFDGIYWVNSSITADLSLYYTKTQTNTNFISANTSLFSFSGHSHYLSGITDVVSGATDGQFLQYHLSTNNWVPVTAPDLTSNFVFRSGDTMTGELSFDYMSGITNRMLYVSTGGTIKEGDEIIDLYITDSGLINLITTADTSYWSGRTFINSGITGYTLYDGQKYIDENYFYEYFSGKMFRTYYADNLHSHNDLYYTKSEFSGTTGNGVLDYRYLNVNALSGFTITSLADVYDYNVLSLTNSDFLRYNTVSGWTNYYLDLTAFTYKNEAVLTGTTVIGISGLTGGGTLNNNIQISHLTKPTKSDIITTTTLNASAILQSIDWDNYGHITSYKTADYSTYWVRNIDDAQDILLINRTANDYLYWTGTKWSNAKLTIDKVSGLISTLNNFVKLSGGTTQTIYGNINLTNNLVVTGDLTVNGTQTIINTTELAIKDNIIHINSGITSPNPYDQSGIRIHRGNKPDYYLVFDEGSSVEYSGGSFKIGVSTDLRTVLTLVGTPLDRGVAFWNKPLNSDGYFDTSSSLTWSGNTLYIPSIETTGIGEGIILSSPNGTRYKITVDNKGNLVSNLA